MEQKVKWSRFAWVITVLVTVALTAGLILTRGHEWHFGLIAVVTVGVFVSMWIWSPVAIAVDTDFLTIRKRIGRKCIPMSEIMSVSSVIPMVMTGFKLCGSGGFAGYYGWYNDMQIGSYFAYYGDRYDCFLIELKNGRQYVIGCEDSAAVVDYVKNQIERNEK